VLEVPIWEKMYPNLLMDNIVKDLEAGADLLKLIQVYNVGWLPEKVGDHMADDASRHGRYGGPLLALVAPPRPLAARKTKALPRPEQQNVTTEFRESRHKTLRLPRVSISVSVPDGGHHKRGTVGQDNRVPKAWRIDSAKGVAGSSKIQDMQMLEAPRQETRREPQRPKKPIQEPKIDRRLKVNIRPPIT
jgi:hypothetical protein